MLLQQKSEMLLRRFWVWLENQPMYIFQLEIIIFNSCMFSVSSSWFVINKVFEKYIENTLIYNKHYRQ